MHSERCNSSSIGNDSADWFCNSINILAFWFVYLVGIRTKVEKTFGFDRVYNTESTQEEVALIRIRSLTRISQLSETSMCRKFHVLFLAYRYVSL